MSSLRNFSVFLYFIGFAAFTSLAQNFSASEPILISDQHGGYHPQIVGTDSGDALVLWTDPISKNCYFTRVSGSNVETPKALNPTGLDVQSYNWSGPDLARWNDDIYVVFREDGYSTGHIYLVKSTDNGQNFSDTIRVDHLNEGYAQYPDVAVYNDTIFITYMTHDKDGLNPQYVVVRSTDGGNNFGNPAEVSSLLGNEACDCCQPELVVNEEYVIQLFRNNNQNIRDIHALVSKDRGLTFQEILQVDQHQWLINACPSTGPDALLDNGKLWSVYKSFENNRNKVFLNEHQLGANTSNLGSVDLSLNLPNNSNYPQIAGKESLLGVVFEGNDQGVDVFFNASTNGIAGLDEANRINLTAKSGNQFKPAIAYSGSAYKFHVVYEDAGALYYVTVDQTQSISELDHLTQNKSLALSKSQNYLMLHEELNYSIHDLQGRKILEQTSNQVDLRALTPGHYIFQTQSGKSELIKRIIITP
ncbi:MAG: hypothetical protein EP338_08745 [Bacteroidetes bacterium]|nr:MAG: hypothetical protein EP338_08745 [Bacteroidota bacterium]